MPPQKWTTTFYLVLTPLKNHQREDHGRQHQTKLSSFVSAVLGFKNEKKNLLSSSPMSAMDHIVTPSKVEIGYFKRERILTKLISAFYSAAVERKKTQRRKNRFFVFFLHRLKFNLSARLLSALYRFQLSCQL